MCATIFYRKPIKAIEGKLSPKAVGTGLYVFAHEVANETEVARSGEASLQAMALAVEPFHPKRVWGHEEVS